MVELDAIEARVIGVLLEKETTTPDQYPLTLNGITTACNQKSNRDPVMNLTDVEVQNCLDGLLQKSQINESRVGNRASKYKHRFCNTEFGDFKFTSKERAIVCVLLLRGPQTPGEIRTRTNRLCDFSDVSEVETTLNTLISEKYNCVKNLGREPGKRESRYNHLFSGDIELTVSSNQISNEPVSTSVINTPAVTASALESELEQRVKKLEEELAMIKDKLGDLLV